MFAIFFYKYLPKILKTQPETPILKILPEPEKSPNIFSVIKSDTQPKPEESQTQKNKPDGKNTLILKLEIVFWVRACSNRIVIHENLGFESPTNST